MRRDWIVKVLAGFLMIGLLGCGDSGTGSNGTPDSREKEETSPSSEVSERTGSESQEQADDSPEAVSFTFTAPSLTREELSEGWVSLFDGQSLFGWSANSSANWRVEDGAITADSGDPGLLLLPFRCGDFEFRCEFLLEMRANSGIFLRTTEQPRDVLRDCYEFNLCDDHPEFTTGSLVGRKTADQETPVTGDWHRLELSFAGPRLIAKIDGTVVQDFIDDGETSIEKGLLGLQMNGGRVAFRNLFWRPLNPEILFNGSNLEGWQIVPGGEAEFAVEDGMIRVRGGAGFLETTRTFQDFVLQFDVRTNSSDINSGVFFRAQRGTTESPSNGYELQICHMFADGDRTRPNDYGTGFGTGAIFRFAPARYVVSNDQQWTSMTLAVDGNRMASFVDGYAVAVWNDERPANENPRRGQRLEAGHLSLQGHDPSTDVSFRNIRISPLNHGSE